MRNARKTDPITSHLAGEEVESSGTAGTQRILVRALVKKHPNLTSHELALHSRLLDRYQVARRLPEVTEIEKGPARKCAISGRVCVTWREKTALSHINNWIDKALRRD